MWRKDLENAQRITNLVLNSSEYMLKTIIDFTSKTMKRIKSKLAIDYCMMHPNIDEIRCLNIILLLRGDYRDTKQILNKLGYSTFISRLFTAHVSTLNATNGVWWIQLSSIKKPYLKIDLPESTGLSTTLRIISGRFTDIHLTHLLMKLWETSIPYLVATLTFTFRTDLENMACFLDVWLQKAATCLKSFLIDLQQSTVNPINQTRN